jgi:3-deoxy-D-manno-octulosonic-acid transferase
MTLGIPVIEVILLSRTFLGKEDPRRINERRGITKLKRPHGNLIWLHASSVGESVAALALIEKLLKTHPLNTILITTGTLTSAKLLKDRLPNDVIHQFVPIDRPAWVKRFLNHWRPNLVLIMESEFWPIQIQQINSRKTPIILINARLSKTSYSRWRWAKSMARSIFGSIELIITTNTEQAQRFETLGARKIQVGGNLKRSAKKLPVKVAATKELQEQIGSRKVWLAASTHEGEDLTVIKTQKLLKTKFPNILTIIVPRHPQRRNEIRLLAQENELAVTCRTMNETIQPETDIYIADTLGEMSIFFDLARYVFIAGSLVPVGGHNPIEPAHFDCAIFFGPLMAKNQEIANEMIQTEAAIQIASDESLPLTLEELLTDDNLSQKLSCNARKYAEDGGTILETISIKISPYIVGIK